MPDEIPDLVPARMLNEYTYCPRLAYIEWAEAEFDDNAFVVDGRRVHARVDVEPRDVPAPDEAKGDKGEGEDEEAPREKIHARSIMLSAPVEGLIAKIDLVEIEGRLATPVDYKRGRKPQVPEGAWDADRVQLCAQGLILRENGYATPGGIVYYAGSKDRVEVAFSDELVGRTRAALVGLRACVLLPERPPPLCDSPKCNGCSLVDICLPEEITLIEEGRAPAADGLRRLLPARDDALPLYVQRHGMYVGKKDDVLVVKEEGKVVAESRLIATSQVCLFGNIGMSAQAIRECCERQIPVCHFGHGGWFYGITWGMGHRNAEVKRVQFRAADREGTCLALARRIVTAKVQNQRTIVRRNHPEPPRRVLDALEAHVEATGKAESLDTLLGIEGMAAKTYFGAFGELLKPRNGGATMAFDFEGRNRRPPRDPVNAMLSFLYAMLTKDCTVTLLSVGLDPHLGFYHQPRFGRPALALDLMEEFRPIIADSTVLTAVNTGIVGPGDFVRAARSVALKPDARRALIAAYERRMDQMVTHPVFGYRISYRRTLEVQARLLVRHLAGELPEFPSFLPR